MDTWLFGGTFRDNIANGRPAASEADILEVVKATYVDRFVRSLPVYDAVLYDEGSNASAGDNQQSIAGRSWLARRCWCRGP